MVQNLGRQLRMTEVEQPLIVSMSRVTVYMIKLDPVYIMTFLNENIMRQCGIGLLSTSFSCEVYEYLKMLTMTIVTRSIYF